LAFALPKMFFEFVSDERGEFVYGKLRGIEN